MDIKKILSDNKKTISYLAVNFLADEHLNLANLEYISKGKIKKIEHLFDPKYFYAYKKKLFWKWDKRNFENTIAYYKRFFKLFKKLDLKLSDNEKDKLYFYKAKYFTKIRNLKTIEAPYKNVKLSSNVLFYYKDVNLYYEENSLFNKILTSDLAISYNEMVFYNSREKRIDFVIYCDEIERILLNEKWVELYLKSGKKYFLRYLEDEITYISFRRIWSKKLDFF